MHQGSGEEAALGRKEKLLLHAKGAGGGKAQLTTRFLTCSRMRPKAVVRPHCPPPMMATSMTGSPAGKQKGVGTRVRVEPTHRLLQKNPRTCSERSGTVAKMSSTS